MKPAALAIGSVAALVALFACSEPDSAAPMTAAGGGTAGATGGSSGSTGGSGTGSNSGGGGSSGSSGSAGTGGAASGGAPSTGGAAPMGGAAGARVVAFETRTLSMEHYAEGAGVGDVDGDGDVDLVAGPRWYAAPDFALGGQLFDAPTFEVDEYSAFFLTFVDDLSGDGRPDVIAIADAGLNGNTVWYENPGPGNLQRDWAVHELFDSVSNESPAYVDLVGDARKELVFMSDGRLGYATRGDTPTSPWTFHAISDDMFDTPFVHGLGVGDVDGDGLLDVVERSGWWRQIEASGAGEPSWERHAVDFGQGLSGTRPSNWGGAQMPVFDVDGDGDSDVVSALAAHRYGLSWFEQQAGGVFVPHVILPDMATDTSFSQQHALALADVNGDGLPDLITGKRYYAHPSTRPDPGTTDPAVIYWFELQRAASGATFVPHLIHDDSGAGCVFAVEDVTSDGRVDVFTTNKRGTFLHVQQ